MENVIAVVIIRSYRDTSTFLLDVDAMKNHEDPEVVKVANKFDMDEIKGKSDTWITMDDVDLNSLYDSGVRVDPPCNIQALVRFYIP